MIWKVIIAREGDEGELQPPIGPKKKRKIGENALSAYLRGLFAAIGVSNDF